MTDRELLELAAKAAGLKHVDYTGIDYDGMLGIVLVDDIGRHCGEFSPLTDDGDALRLAVDCGIGMRFHDGWGEVFHPDVGCLAFEYEDDKRKATRHVISMVAAEIGKAMQ